MNSPTYQDPVTFREWTPLTTLLQKLPSKIQSGLFTQDVNFTCIDAICEGIAIGTDQSIVYWFDRKTGELQSLGCESANSSITCVKIVSTVDYMVAAGNDLGIVTIFQIPKEVPDILPEIFKPKRKKQVERFNVSGLHMSPVTTVEWSKNGMKLFSGDQNGLIVKTEMDFYMHLSKSTELLNEKYAIVQLSYQNALLLISTLFRTIIVNINQNNQVTQVGQKERKLFGKLGAVFLKNKNNIQEPSIYASRPGLRIWQADKNGVVLKTLILKEAVKVAPTYVELLNPVSESSKKKGRGDPVFGIILPFTNGLLVTYNEDFIYLVNPSTVTITAIISNLRKVTDVACTEDEIFILEGERNVIRIACYPEITNYDTAEDYDVNQHTSGIESNKSISWAFSGITSRLKSTPLYKIKPTSFAESTSILPAVVVGIDTTSIANAEEAVEIPPIVPLQLDTPLVTGIDALKSQSECYDEKKVDLVDRKDIFQKIAEQDFEEVLFTPRKKEQKLLEETNTQLSKSETTVEEDNASITVNSNKKKIFNYSDNTSEPVQIMNNDLLLESKGNSENIKKAVEDKEKLLFSYLNLDLSKYKEKNQSHTMSNSFCFRDLNEHKKDLNYFFTMSKSEIAQISRDKKQDVDFQTSQSEKTKLTNFAGSSRKVSNTEKRNEPLWQARSETEDKKLSETHFNALSKEFVKSTINQDNDDWILLG